ncbi:MAG TPA: fibronectin type III domain-containing protein [Gemmatimonadales bacterium]|nr:fibronectin type III domain-containing protein [Gemmatimonadales bacterium]
MKFPEAEPEIAALALLVIEGLRQLEAELPAPPVSADELQARLDRFNGSKVRVVAANTALRNEHTANDQDLKSLVDATKATLKYAEVVFRDQPSKLSQLGWGPRRDGSSLEAPGEVRDIRIVAEGDTWITLRWSPPVSGGAVGMYKIQRKTKDAGAWEDAGSSVDTVLTLSRQPRGIEMDYRVLAANKAGVGQPSATVTVVL